jgi:uncharacterized membrane protein YeaQ/YmgE (transglycosylase-associated protein family)
MSEKKEEKQVKVNLSFTSEKLFLYGAIADAVLGVVWAICAVVGNSGAYKAAGFFQGLFWAILGSLVLYGLSQIVKSKQ